MRRGAVLIVEDDQESAELTIEALRLNGIGEEIVLARDGAEALEFLRARRPAHETSLILLDLQMPRMDGIETLSRLRADARTREIPVLIVSSSEDPDDLAHAYAAGANGYVFKLLSFENFVKAIGAAASFFLGARLAARAS